MIFNKKVLAHIDLFRFFSFVGFALALYLSYIHENFALVIVFLVLIIYDIIISLGASNAVEDSTPSSFCFSPERFGNDILEKCNFLTDRKIRVSFVNGGFTKYPYFRSRDGINVNEAIIRAGYESKDLETLCSTIKNAMAAISLKDEDGIGRITILEKQISALEENLSNERKKHQEELWNEHLEVEHYKDSLRRRLNDEQEQLKTLIIAQDIISEYKDKYGENELLSQHSDLFYP